MPGSPAHNASMYGEGNATYIMDKGGDSDPTAPATLDYFLVHGRWRSSISNCVTDHSPSRKRFGRGKSWDHAKLTLKWKWKVHKPTSRESKPDLEVINPASARYVPQVQEAFDAKAAELLGS
jgi:hypothetical protein